MDEADTVKNDGSFIYMLPQAYGVSQTLVIARAYPADSAEVVSTTDLAAYSLWPRSLLLHDDVSQNPHSAQMQICICLTDDCFAFYRLCWWWAPARYGTTLLPSIQAL